MNNIGDGDNNRPKINDAPGPNKSKDLPNKDASAKPPEMFNNDLNNADEVDDEVYEYSDDFEEDTGGEESDIEDNGEDGPPFVMEREENPNLPTTVTLLETPAGSKVYVVGTAHFSTESQEDVTKTIVATKPDVVMVELCNSRIKILELNEEKLLEEAQNLDFEKVRLAIKQNGVTQGIMHLLFLSMSAHITKQLGMAPGGEFRRAFQEAKKIPGCRLQLGDRPIQITLQRAIGALSVWQKMRLGWYLLTSKDPISKEDIEKCKQADLLEEMLREMTGEFPGLSQVFVDERDMFLAHSLKHAAQPLRHPAYPNGIPRVVVGVVGMGHVPGITAKWDQQDYNIKEIMTIPEEGPARKIIRFGFRLSLLAALGYGCYRLHKWTNLKFR